MKVTVPIFKSFYDLECQEHEKNELERISKIVNKDISSLSAQSHIRDEKTLFALYAIALNKELEQLKNSNKPDNDNNDSLNQKIIDLTNHVKDITYKINP